MDREKPYPGKIGPHRLVVESPHYGALWRREHFRVGELKLLKYRHPSPAGWCDAGENVEMTREMILE